MICHIRRLVYICANRMTIGNKNFMGGRSKEKSYRQKQCFSTGFLDMHKIYFAILAQLSFNATVRLNINLSGVESGSTLK